MKLEDVREGMWLRFQRGVGRIGPVDPGSLERPVIYADGSRGGVTLAGIEAAVPWAPRLGDWVRFTERSSPNQTRHPFQVAVVDSGVFSGVVARMEGVPGPRDGTWMTARAEHLEPCMAPAPAPYTHTVESLKSGAAPAPRFASPKDYLRGAIQAWREAVRG